MRFAIGFLAICYCTYAQNVFMTGQRGPNKPGPVEHTPDGKPNLEGYWISQVPGAVYGVEEHPGAFALFGGKSIVIDPPDGKIPYQGWARAKQQDLQLHHMYEEPEAHCSQSGVPHQIWTQFGFHLLQPRGYVVMLWEFMHGNRIIAMDGRPHIDAKIKLTQGDSIGHWEGDTLVVDRVNFEEQVWLDQEGHPHSDKLHIVERYRRPDLGHLETEVTVEDPGILARPYTMKRVSDLAPGEEIREFICTENNRDLEHLVGR
jgi:hypothetical protein